MMKYQLFIPLSDNISTSQSSLLDSLKGARKRTSRGMVRHERAEGGRRQRHRGKESKAANEHASLKWQGSAHLTLWVSSVPETELTTSVD